MRLDKYLKVSRLIKRRTVAKKAIVDGFVSVNNKIEKPGYKVSLSDKIEIRFAAKTIAVEVTALNPKKNTSMYNLLNERKVTS